MPNTLIFHIWVPEHLTDVYRVNPGDKKVAEAVRILMQSQLGEDGLFIGNLLAGETPLEGVPVQLPPYALSHHIAIFGRTGCGKSNLMMVLLRSILGHNQLVFRGKRKGPRCSIFAIDPHDEFQTWHARTGGADGVRGVINAYSPKEQKDLVDPFYYLTAKDLPGLGLERKVRLSRPETFRWSPGFQYHLPSFRTSPTRGTRKIFFSATMKRSTWRASIRC